MFLRYLLIFPLNNLFFFYFLFSFSSSFKNLIVKDKKPNREFHEYNLTKPNPIHMKILQFIVFFPPFTLHFFIYCQ